VEIPTPSLAGTIDETTPVLIAGGGLTGLSTALFLAHQGVRPLLVERHPDLLIHPRARGFTPRTVEILRQVGLEPAIRAAAFAATDAFAWVAVRGETLAGELTPVPEPSDGGWEGASPAPFGPIDQDKLEALIRAKAAELGADLRFGTELVSFGQDDAGVTARLRDLGTGAERTVRAAFLVAADGHASPVRHRLGIELDGPGPFFQVLTAMVAADLRPALRGRRVSIAYLDCPRPGTTFLAHDDAGLHWVFGIGYSPPHERLEDYPAERVAALIAEAAGLPGVAVVLKPQIPGTDRTLLGWPIGAHLARRYRQGRIFLAGDAAHIVPPTGGFGANTGIQDAHNLAWKLAAVLRGGAGPGLLDSYHDERHPVGALTMGQALARWQTRVGHGTGPAAEPLLDYAAVAFGYRYRSGAVLDAPADLPPALPLSRLRGQPGTRAPHVWLDRDGQRLSTIDRFGRGFVLLAGPHGGAWVGAARRLAARRDLPVSAELIGPGGDLGDPEGRFARGYSLAGDGAVLVRPDGFVAWRAETGAGDPEGALEQAVARLLDRAPVAARVATGFTEEATR